MIWSKGECIEFMIVKRIKLVASFHKILFHRINVFSHWSFFVILCPINKERLRASLQSYCSWCWSCQCRLYWIRTHAQRNVTSAVQTGILEISLFFQVIGFMHWVMPEMIVENHNPLHHDTSLHASISFNRMYYLWKKVFQNESI